MNMFVTPMMVLITQKPIVESQGKSDINKLYQHQGEQICSLL